MIERIVIFLTRIFGSDLSVSARCLQHHQRSEWSQGIEQSRIDWKQMRLEMDRRRALKKL